MNHLAKLAATNAMTLQGQPCLVVDHLQPAADPVNARCIARPSVHDPFGERFSSEKYDVTVLREVELQSGDQVHLLDDNNEVEMILVIAKPEQLLTAIRVYSAIPKPL